MTRDREDFYDLTIQFLENQWPHAGVLIVPRALPNERFTAIAEAMVAYAEGHEGDLPSYLVDYLRAPRRR